MLIGQFSSLENFLKLVDFGQNSYFLCGNDKSNTIDSFKFLKFDFQFWLIIGNFIMIFDEKILMKKKLIQNFRILRLAMYWPTGNGYEMTG